MIRLIFTVLMAMSSAIVALATEQLTTDTSTQGANTAQIDSLLNTISVRELNLGQTKGDKKRADTLELLVDDYALLADLWQNECQNAQASMALKSRELDALEVLITDSDTVFNTALPAFSTVPVSLRNHYRLIEKVILVQKSIETLEKSIEEKNNACLAIDQNPAEVIPGLISEDIDAIYNQITEIMQTSLATFSEKQREYFDTNIKARYNNFKKYF